MNSWVIKDIYGNILYNIEDNKIKNKRSFINYLIAKKVSFENANLSNFDLSNLTLSGLNFTNANLTKVDLKGSFCINTDFLNANLTSCQLQGGNFESSNFDGSDLSNADFDGAKAVHSSYRGATFFKTHFSNVACRGSNFNHANIKNSDFYKSNMINCDFSNAIIYHSNFSFANLKQNIFKNLPNTALDYLLKYTPNRTENTIVVGCKFHETELDESVQVFAKDKEHFSFIKKVSWFTSNASVVYASDKTNDVIHDYFSTLDISNVNHLLGLNSSIGVISVLTAASILTFVQHITYEKFRDKADFFVDNITEKLKLYCSEVKKYNKQTKDILVLIGKNNSMTRMRDVLLATQPQAAKKGFFSKIQYLFSGSQDVIMCDKSHFSLAMSMLSNYRDHKFKITEDVLFVRNVKKNDALPRIITLKTDGSCNILWEINNEKYVFNFKKNGELNNIYDDNNNIVTQPIKNMPIYAYNKAESIYVFEEAVCLDVGIDFEYDRDTHYVQSGKNGSLFVKNKTTKRIDNIEGQPAILLPSINKMFFAKNGEIDKKHINPLRKMVANLDLDNTNKIEEKPAACQSFVKS